MSFLFFYDTQLLDTASDAGAGANESIVLSKDGISVETPSAATVDDKATNDASFWSAISKTISGILYLSVFLPMEEKFDCYCAEWNLLLSMGPADCRMWYLEAHEGEQTPKAAALAWHISLESGMEKDWSLGAWLLTDCLFFFVVVFVIDIQVYGCISSNEPSTALNLRWFTIRIAGMVPNSYTFLSMLGMDDWNS